jgi:hypothetical protein
MSASKRRPLVIAMIVMAIAVARLPAQDEEIHKAQTMAAVQVFGAGDKWATLAALNVVCQNVEAWRLPVRNFWLLNPAGPEIQGAMHVIGPGNAYAALAARMLASELPSPLVMLDTEVGKVKWRFDFDEPLPLPSAWLSRIQDRQPIPEVRAKELKGADEAWYRAFNKALEYSHRDNMDVALDKFKKGAEPNQRVLFLHLRDQPEKYRGKIVTVHGELLVVREEPAPRYVGPDLKNIYTGYIVGTKGVPPYTVAFTELPDEIKAIPRRNWENLHLDVTFHGYFLSLVRFPEEKGVKSKKDQISPYLVGRSLTVHGKAKTPLPDEGSYSYPIILSTVGGILAMVIAGALLNVWLRRGDRRTQSQLAQVRDKHNPFNVEPAEPEPSE